MTRRALEYLPVAGVKSFPGKTVRRLLAGWLLAAVLLLLAAGPAYAAGLSDDKIIFGDNFTLAAGEVVDGNLVVFGGNVVLEEGSEVTGDVVVFGGNVDIAGQVGDNVSVFGGNVDLRSSARVGGELITVGGSPTREVGAEVAGGESQGFETSPPMVNVPRPLQPIFNLFMTIFNVIATSIGLSLLALLVLLFWPEHTARVAAAAASSPGASGGLGLVTLIAAPFLVVALVLTCLGIPVALLAAGLVLPAAMIFGWLALGSLVGARLAAALNLSQTSPAVAGALGTLLFSLVANIIGLIPCVGWIFPTALGVIGLGAVILTRFGARPYLGLTPPVSAPPAPLAPVSGDAVNG